MTLAHIIKIKYRSPETKRLEFVGGITTSNWIDLSCDERTILSKGDFKLIPLGVAMQLPQDFEANIVPRSSTFSKYKILQVNSYGVIDSSYAGDNDYWFFGALATEDTVIERGARICQFRINKIQPPVLFDAVEVLGNKDRKGHGSTGI